MHNHHRAQHDRWIGQVAPVLGLAVFVLAVHASRVQGQSWIPDNFPALNWQPTIAPPGARYIGNQECANCHTAEAKSYLTTAMARALETPEGSTVLRAKSTLSFRNGPFLYAVVKVGNGSSLSVSDGTHTISAPIRWAVGHGVGGVGQTFVLEYGGLFYESQVSYYAGIRGLDITMGHASSPPTLLEEALGNWLDETALTACVRCHATAATTGNHLQLDQMMPGIGCEGCHGPGTNHIEAVRAANPKDLRIFNPGHLPPGRITDFCGACHRTTAQEKVLNIHGVENARFQAYRLERSRCYSRADLRISCVACHNPHQAIERRVSVYDGKCLTCHSAPSGTDHGCPVSKQNCVTCHMPRVSVPGARTMFTDHWIRVAKPNEPYPD